MVEVLRLLLQLACTEFKVCSTSIWAGMTRLREIGTAWHVTRAVAEGGIVCATAADVYGWQLRLIA